MGCGSSTTAVVHPIRPTDEVGKSVEGDIEGKCGRGDSAVSKVTEDSGVVMAPVVQNAEVLPVDAFPGEVPVKPPGLLGREVPMRDPPTSSDILQELQNEGIIPASPSRETTTGRAYTIMLDDSEGIRRRPPARLESLKVKRLPSKEEMEEKMRLADERRKSREDELTARLRSKSARVRRAAAFVPPRSPPDVEGVRRSASGAAAPEAGERARDDEESALMEAELLPSLGALESDAGFRRGGDKEIFFS